LGNYSALNKIPTWTIKNLFLDIERNQMKRAFTLTELLVAIMLSIITVICLGCAIVAGYIAVHLIAKI
jgi:hypothetical protein